MAADVRPGVVPAGATPEWASVFRAVPRHRFLPGRIWPFSHEDGFDRAVDRDADAAAWLAVTESAGPVITQWDDGAHTGAAPGRTATSSASAPGLVARMLGLLDVEPGARVLEIGTGTGWNAGLLAHRLGDDHVVTVEVDETVAESARKALAGVGLHPRVVTGDGALGVPDAAPFDRVIVTAGVRRFPRAWLEQTRPGGLILAPWGTPYRHVDALVRLVVQPDGSAAGRLVELVEFMKLRDQRTRQPTYPADLPITDGTTDVWPPHAPGHPFPFLAGLRLRDVMHAVQAHEDGHTQWLYSLRGDTWCAAVRRESTGPEVWVRQAGPRALWDELLDVHAWWRDAGEPVLDRFGLTVRPGGEHVVWLDDPEDVVTTIV